MIDEIPLMPEVVAKMLGLSEKQLANLRTQGRGPPYFKAGALVRYSPAKLRAWIEAGGDGPQKKSRKTKATKTAASFAAGLTPEELGRLRNGQEPGDPSDPSYLGRLARTRVVDLVAAGRAYAAGRRLSPDNQP